MFDDFQFLNNSQIEKMAIEYANSLKEKGFTFVKLEDEIQISISNYLPLIKEIFSLLFKLKKNSNSKEMEKSFSQTIQLLLTRLDSFDNILDIEDIKINNVCDGIQLLLIKLSELIKILLNTLKENNSTFTIDFLIDLDIALQDTSKLLKMCKTLK